MEWTKQLKSNAYGRQMPFGGRDTTCWKASFRTATKRFSGYGTSYFDIQPEAIHFQYHLSRHDRGTSMKMIRKGEYDLVNISLIGHDPISGRTYEQCQDEWDAERDRVVKAWESVRWWNIWQHVSLRWAMMVLYSRRGY